MRARSKLQVVRPVSLDGTFTDGPALPKPLVSIFKCVHLVFAHPVDGCPAARSGNFLELYSSEVAHRAYSKARQIDISFSSNTLLRTK